MPGSAKKQIRKALKKQAKSDRKSRRKLRKQQEQEQYEQEQEQELDYDSMDVRERALAIPFRAKKKMLKNMVTAEWESITTYNLDDVRVCLVGSRKHEGQWILPAGGVESGENFFEAAERETMEEAGLLGIPVEEVLGVVVEKSKRGTLNETSCFAFEVIKQLDDDEWEESYRGRQWVSIYDAIDLLDWKPSCATALQLFVMTMLERGLILTAHPFLVEKYQEEHVDRELLKEIDWINRNADGEEFDQDYEDADGTFYIEAPDSDDDDEFDSDVEDVSDDESVIEFNEQGDNEFDVDDGVVYIFDDDNENDDDDDDDDDDQLYNSSRIEEIDEDDSSSSSDDDEDGFSEDSSYDYPDELDEDDGNRRYFVIEDDFYDDEEDEEDSDSSSDDE